MNFHLLLGFVVLLVLSGCNTIPVKTNSAHLIPPEKTHLEEIKRTITTGHEMTSSASFNRFEILNLQTRVQSMTAHRGRERVLVARSSEYALVAADADGKYFEAVTDGFSLNGNSTASGGVYVPNNSDTKPALYWSGARWLDHPTSNRVDMYMSDLSESLDFSMSEAIKLPANFLNGLAATLVYLGMAGGQIKFVYREFNDGYARPAFTQEISLDYQPEKLYSYRDARFTVHSANTNEITFTLHHPL